MEKKVLGFRKEDTDEFYRNVSALNYSRKKNKYNHSKDDRYTIKIRCDKLVPVVSLEDLEKEVLRLAKVAGKNGGELEKIFSYTDAICDVLTWARKKAGVKETVRKRKTVGILKK